MTTQEMTHGLQEVTAGARLDTLHYTRGYVAKSEFMQGVAPAHSPLSSDEISPFVALHADHGTIELVGALYTEPGADTAELSLDIRTEKAKHDPQLIRLFVGHALLQGNARHAVFNAGVLDDPQSSQNLPSIETLLDAGFIPQPSGELTFHIAA